ncbi:MAG: hypothetical protein HXY38_15900 [Chloroflexi bacterium]|nr:hypothetical protein [Chloroflexota bacterium]
MSNQFAGSDSAIAAPATGLDSVGTQASTQGVEALNRADFGQVRDAMTVNTAKDHLTNLEIDHGDASGNAFESSTAQGNTDRNTEQAREGAGTAVTRDSDEGGEAGTDGQSGATTENAAPKGKDGKGDSQVNQDGKSQAQGDSVNGDNEGLSSDGSQENSAEGGGEGGTAAGGDQGNTPEFNGEDGPATDSGEATQSGPEAQSQGNLGEGADGTQAQAPEAISEGDQDQAPGMSEGDQDQAPGMSDGGASTVKKDAEAIGGQAGADSIKSGGASVDADPQSGDIKEGAQAHGQTATQATPGTVLEGTGDM